MDQDKHILVLVHVYLLFKALLEYKLVMITFKNI